MAVMNQLLVFREMHPSCVRMRPSSSPSFMTMKDRPVLNTQLRNVAVHVPLLSLHIVFLDQPVNFSQQSPKQQVHAEGQLTCRYSS